MFVQQVMQLFVSQVISVLYAYNKIHYLQQTIKPPSKKLGYWRTYTNHHRFCWDCEDAICRNKVFKNHLSIAKDPNTDKYLTSHRFNGCTYQIKHKYPVYTS
uniref:I12R CDS n=1 Tax=African swine fever virus TaxID=10497 RepID=A0A7R8Z3Y0_ASF|nr:I12R CDS [African swine fever virus]